MSLSPSYMIPLHHFWHDRQHPVEGKEKERFSIFVGSLYLKLMNVGMYEWGCGLKKNQDVECSFP